MDPNRWNAFTDAELVFLLEAVEYGDVKVSHGSRDLDLWESLLDAVEARSEIDAEWVAWIAQDRAAIERYRNSPRRKAPPPSPEPLSDGRRLPGVSVTYHQG